MSDGVNITQGSGTLIAADNVAGTFYQRIKVETGDLDKIVSDPIQLAITSSSSGSNVLIAAFTSKVIRVTSLVIIASGAVTVQFTDTTPTNLTGSMSLDTKGGFAATAELKGLFQTASGKGLSVTLGSATAIAGFLTYVTF